MLTIATGYTATKQTRTVTNQRKTDDHQSATQHDKLI